MEIRIRKYEESDIPGMVSIWNEVVEEGVAFPQTEYLTQESGRAFFADQTWCAVAQDVKSGKLLGLYILHPNNIGRCGHICNASYAVSSDARGRQIGRKLVEDSLIQAKHHNFRIMQFNAVVAGNTRARNFLPLPTEKEPYAINDITHRFTRYNYLDDSRILQWRV